MLSGIPEFHCALAPVRDRDGGEGRGAVQDELMCNGDDHLTIEEFTYTDGTSQAGSTLRYTYQSWWICSTSMITYMQTLQ